MEKNKEIDLCVIVDDNFIRSKYIIENVLYKCSCEFYNLYIYSQTIMTKEQQDYYNGLKETIKELDITIKDFDNEKLSVMYNTFIDNSTCNYISICPKNIIIPEYSLELMKYFHKNVNDTGICSIKTNLHNKELTSFLTSDEFDIESYLQYLYQDTEIHITDSATILFKRDLVENIGYFDLKLSDEFIMQDYLYRSMSVLKNNYYIPFKTAFNFINLKNETENKNIKEELRAFTNNLNEMLKQNKFKKLWK